MSELGIKILNKEIDFKNRMIWKIQERDGVHVNPSDQAAEKKLADVLLELQGEVAELKSAVKYLKQFKKQTNDRRPSSRKDNTANRFND